MKKILITGKDSYIGTSFERYMANFDGYEIDTVDVRDDGWKTCDFSRYDVVFHVAGIAHIKETKKNADLYYSVNRDLAVEVAQKSQNEGVGQLIFLSSMSVYGLTTGAISADTIPNPKSNYGKSKLQAEEKIKKLHNDDMAVCILRPPMVYGAGCRGNYSTLSKYAKKLPFFPNVNNRRSMLYIENLCEFIRLMVANDESGIFMPQNSEYVSTSEMVKLIANISGKNIRLTRIFNPFLRLFLPVIGVINKVFGSLTYEMSISEYKENYRVCSFEESIRRTEMG